MSKKLVTGDFMTPKNWLRFAFVCVVGSAVAQGGVRIVGGVEATPGEYPFMASLQKSGRHFCGGSLVAKSWILTAAHCVKSASASSLTVKLGLHKTSDTRGVEKFGVKKIITHPDYSSWSSTHDYALLKLDGESRLEPIQLNERELDIAAEESDAQTSTTAGWGTTSQGGGLATMLRKVDVPLVSKARCDAAYPESIDDTMICAGFEKGGKDSCQGDSGGPLMIHGDTTRPVLIGIVSWGEGCAKPKKYGVYAKVSAGLQWIEDNMK